MAPISKQTADMSVEESLSPSFPRYRSSNSHYNQEKSSYSTSYEYSTTDGITKRGLSEAGEQPPLATEEDVVRHVLHAEDNTSYNVWTVRMFFLGTGLGVFGAVMETIYYFRPVTIDVSNIFLALLGYVFGTAMEKLIPRKGVVGRWLNPHPFTQKEHAAVVVMASSASQVALAVNVIAAQRLFYKEEPSVAVAILIVFSSQCLGYGFAGLLRRALVYPSKMVWPSMLPMNALLETLHRDKKETKDRLKLFYWVFAAIAVWEVFPEYVMPILTGVSVFCLAKRDSLVFTYIFGGSNGNEGLGLLSLGLDWQFITSKPLWYPLETLTNNLVGYVICICLFVGVYFGNAWRAMDFPFLSQLLFSGASNSSLYVQYNQTAILDEQNVLKPEELAEQGIPFFTGTYAMFLLTNNLAATATISHLLLWNWDSVKAGLSFPNPTSLWHRITRRKPTQPGGSGDDNEKADEESDAHYQLMRAYPECPDWWYAAILLISIGVGLLCLYLARSTLPWHGFLVSILLSGLFILFFGAQAALTGFQGNAQPIVQMIGGYLHPGRPLANMYFTLFGYNSVVQGISLVQDLKFGQYAKIPPRATFATQLAGTLVGAVVNYAMMDQITTSQREILLSVQGTNVWSGQNIQQFNSQAIAWGAFARELFSPGARYFALPLGLLVGFVVPIPTYLLHRAYPRFSLLKSINTPIILAYAGFLAVGVSSYMLSYFVVGFASQLWLRRRRPAWFARYNYVLAAALDGGTQVLVFVLTFAVLGGAGTAVPFPRYWGNNAGGNLDYCMRDPAAAGISAGVVDDD
ncbi:peptide transporter mtd1 [Colletotrichum musicola]|uniref:Peptide transporter mtd1 n=1 Tax=Colletotrichum musicola TaxID=2175873 RepID=A0A8H6MUY2_9PEZI|nr:peptide transporter mtd1 [Colletotrichum musicola]